MKRWLCVCVLVGLLAPATAGAHSALRDAFPEPGGVLSASPRVVTLSFTEAVDPRLAVVRVQDADGHRLDVRRVTSAGARTLRAQLRRPLPKGGYTVFYRVVSEDGHQGTGGYGFAVGPGSTAPRVATVPALGRGSSGLAATVARTLRDGGVVIVLGSALFAVLVAGAPVRGLIVGGGWAAALGALAGVWLVAPGAAGFETRFGTASALVAALAVLLIVVAPRGADRPVPAETARRPGPPRRSVRPAPALAVSLAGPGYPVVSFAGARGATADGGAAGPAVAVPQRWSHVRSLVVVVIAGALALAMAFAGHAASRADAAVLVPATAVHVFAASVWVGGIASLLVTGRAVAPSAIRRFAPVALGSVVALAVSGLITAIIEVGSFSELLGTAFGRTIVLKTGVLLVVVGVAADHRGARPGSAARRTLRREAAGLAVAVVLAAALAGFPPPGGVAAGPAPVQLTFEQAELRGTLTRDRLRFTLTRPGQGVAFGDLARLRVAVTQGTTTLRLTAQPRADGTYALALKLPRTGAWRLKVTLDVDRFNVFTREQTITVR